MMEAEVSFELDPEARDRFSTGVPSGEEARASLMVAVMEDRATPAERIDILVEDAFRRVDARVIGAARVTMLWRGVIQVRIDIAVRDDHPFDFESLVRAAIPHATQIDCRRIHHRSDGDVYYGTGGGCLR